MTMRILSFILGVLLISSPALAAPMTLQYSGTITDMLFLPTTYFNVGDSVHVQYTFNNPAIDERPADPTLGLYGNSLISLSATFGNYTVTATTNVNMQVGNDYTGQGGIQDYFNIVSVSQSWSGGSLVPVSGQPFGSWEPIQFVLQFADPTATAFTTDALPLTILDPANFVSPNTYTSLTFVDQATGLTAGVNASFNPAPVPEPSTLLLLGSGLAGLGYVRRRFKR